MLPRLLHSIRTFRNDPSQVDETLPVSTWSATEPADAEVVVAESGSAEVVLAEPVPSAAPSPAQTGLDTVARGSDLSVDVESVTGPRPAEVPRRAQHALRESSVRAAGPKIRLMALGLSVLAVTALAVGTVRGLRSDQASPAGVTGQAMLAARQADLLDGRQEDVAGARAAAVAGWQAEQERAQAAAAAQAAQVAQAAQRQAEAEAQAQAAAAAAAAKARQAAAAQAARSAGRTSTPVPGGSPQSIAQAMLAQRGWSGQWSCLNSLWQKESGWNYRARNPYSGAFGIPQALPGGKMASAGPDWQTNPATQIAWGLRYIASTYGTPCGAWAHSQSTGWY